MIDSPTDDQAASPGPTDDVLLDVRNLKTYYPVTGGILRRRTGWVKAVDDVSFAVKHGETLGLVGESGCGKTTVGRSIIRLVRPLAGQVTFEGRDILTLPGREMKGVRKNLQIIFQDPYGSLNPRMTVGEIVGEGLRVHGAENRQEREKVVADTLSAVGLRKEYVRRYPHEFSGGQRQRIVIARALAVRPRFIVGDEPVSALDVSIQSQVLNLLKDLQKEFGLTYLFIAHDLSVVEYISDRVGVMYLGKLVELASAEELYKNPRMPYTKALLSAIPVPDPTVKKQRIVLQGEVPSPINPPSGCPFRTRCWMAQDICAQQTPPLREVSPGHWAACHFA
jgi:peptide/nickel transport system ATP-binding protein/oligopeptide transport system ATP-binding protein